MTKYNKSEIMKNAWAIRKAYNVSMSEALKKAWAAAKSPKEENNMQTEAIKNLISKYNLTVVDGKVRTYARNVNKDDFIREVAPLKQEIIQYIETEKKAASDRLSQRTATFNSIPGVAEVQKARSQRAEWLREFNKMMETGSSFMPCIEAPTAQQLKEIEDRNPMAVFALEAEYRAAHTPTFELSEIWHETYEAICSGEDIAAVRAAHDKKMSDFTAKNMWN